MGRMAVGLGYASAAIMGVSSVMHSFFGWPAMARMLQESQAAPELIEGLAYGWHFGGLTMAVFGVTIATAFHGIRQGRVPALLPLALIALLYLGFGAAALVISRFDPFFFMFIVPGLLLAIALLRVRHVAAKKPAA